MNDDQMDELLIQGVRDYNAPAGDPPREEMWRRIQAARAEAQRAAVPGVVAIESHPSRRWFRPGVAAAAAVILAAGIAIGRYFDHLAPKMAPVVASTATAPRPDSANRRDTSTDSLVRRLEQETAKTGERARALASAEPATNGVAGDNGAATNQSLAYRLVVLQHLAGSEAMITSFRSSARNGQLDAELASWSRELLSTTRLLESSQASTDPVMKRLLDDLDLVISQIVQYTNKGTANPEELDLIEQSINKRGVMSKLRSTLPARNAPAGSWRNSTMKKSHIITFALRLAGTVAATAGAQGVRSARSAGVIAIPGEEPADSLFRVGRQLMADGEYRRAADVFKLVADRYPQSKSASDALYWRAWSLQKLGADRSNKGDLDDALATITRLERDYPRASNLTDAQSLRSTIRSTQASLGDPKAARDVAGAAKGLSEQRSCPVSSADDEVRMAALDGLMSMNSADAIPILQDVLKQRDPCRVELRKKAVFLISQKRGPEVASTLLDVARSDPSVDVRGEAIQWLSQSRSEAAIPALDSVLFQSKEDEIRKKAIFALSQLARDEKARASLQRAAQDERMPEELREEAVFWLGQSKAVDLTFFKNLFRTTKNPDLRKKIAFSVSQVRTPEATAWLLDVAKDKSFDVDIRKDAIFSLSQGRQIDVEGLQTIYNGARDEPEIQEQVIFVYSQTRETTAVDKLMEIAKSDPKLENRKKAIFWLGQKNDPRVKQFLRDLLK